MTAADTSKPALSAAPPPPPSADGHAGGGKLAGAVRAVSGMTLLSRIGGLARDLLLIHIFGATKIGSAFNAGFAIPNLFRRLFGEGALSAAFIPEYAQAHKVDPARADRLASLTIFSLFLGTTIITVLVELALLAGLLLLPHTPARTLSFQLIMLMLPFMPLVCVAAILGGMLQVHGRFAPAASGPVLLNGLIVVAGVYSLVTHQLAGERMAYVLGAVTVASGFTQCFWFFRLLRPHVAWTRSFDDAGDGARRMLRRFVPVLIGMGTLQINTFMDILLAMWPIWVGTTLFGRLYPMDEKSNAILTFMQRLYQFPLGVFGIAVATAVFPMLARHADEPLHFLQTLRRGLRLSLFIGLPASLGLILVRHDLTEVLCGGRSGFDAPAMARASAVLAGFAPAVWAYSLNHVFTRAFYAHGDTRTPMKVAIWMVALNFLLNMALIWSLREAGLAWATATSATVQCVILGWCSRRYLAGPLVDRDMLGAVVRTALAGALMGAVVIGVQLAFSAPTTWHAHAVRLAAMCASGVGSYALAAWLLRAHELRWLIRSH